MSNFSAVEVWFQAGVYAGNTGRRDMVVGVYLGAHLPMCTARCRTFSGSSPLACSSAIPPDLTTGHHWSVGHLPTLLPVSGLSFSKGSACIKMTLNDVRCLIVKMVVDCIGGSGLHCH